jgi:hypothetical protein
MWTTGQVCHLFRRDFRDRDRLSVGHQRPHFLQESLPLWVNPDTPGRFRSISCVRQRWYRNACTTLFAQAYGI